MRWSGGDGFVGNGDECRCCGDDGFFFFVFFKKIIIIIFKNAYFNKIVRNLDNRMEDAF
jgi:hypothetical protein